MPYVSLSGEASIQSSLQELADLLGEDEAPREREGREQRSSVQSTPTNEAKRGEESPQQSRKKQTGTCTCTCYFLLLGWICVDGLPFYIRTCTCICTLS